MGLALSRLKMTTMTTENLLVELFVEELPPKALKKLGAAFAAELSSQLQAQGLLENNSTTTPYASPRRLAAHITAVRAQAPDKTIQTKLMPTRIGLDEQGKATPALLKKLGSLGLDADAANRAVAELTRKQDGKEEALFYAYEQTGAVLRDGLQKALDYAIGNLPIPKVMTYQLASNCDLPGWSSVQFVRPAHGLMALHGAAIVPVQTLGLQAGNSTHGHRFEAQTSPITIAHADEYEAILEQQGAVIADFTKRQQSIIKQLQTAADKLGGGYKPIEDAALLDEVTALVERPNVLVCQFEKEFLAVPQECLILTMKANQKYFPLLDKQGTLSNHFLVVSNITPDNADNVIQGNERVIRPRLADAKFFFDQDRKKTLASRVDDLSKVVYHNRLGSQKARSDRVYRIATGIVQQLRLASEKTIAISSVDFDTLKKNVQQAAQLAKTDLLTDMVGEFPELQGIMGAYYARHEGLDEAIASAIEDHYKPRFAGDTLPRNHTGIVLALADKLETLVGMFGIGNVPTGDKDPFALRRHALGVIRILIEENVPLTLEELMEGAFNVFNNDIDIQEKDSSRWLERTKKEQERRGKKSIMLGTSKRALFGDEVLQKLREFVFDRLSGFLKSQKYTTQEVESVLAVKIDHFTDIPNHLQAVRNFMTLPEAAALAAANKRVGNILKKAEADDAVTAQVNAALLQEEAEQALYAAVQKIAPQSQQQFDAGDYTASLQILAALKAPVDVFFEKVMVNADDAAVRNNRLSLLKMLHQAMNKVADLGRLAA